VRIARQERQQELRQQALEHERDNFRFYELPWMNRQVVTELYQPDAQWRKDADEKRRKRKEFHETPITIAEHEYSKDSSLAELTRAQKLLRRRGGERLSKQDFSKFRSWISDKELEAQTGQKAHPDPDKFEFQGRLFTRDTDPGELRAVRKFLSETQRDPDPRNHRRLPSEDNDKLRQWLEDSTRADGAGSPEAAMKQALTRQSNEEQKYAEAADLLTQQQTLGRNPVLALFTDEGSIDPRDRAARDQREQLRQAEQQIVDTLENQEQAAAAAGSTTAEQEQSIKHKKYTRFIIRRYLDQQTAREEQRKRKERDSAHEQELDDQDFSIER
jgi:hypothetical protein